MTPLPCAIYTRKSSEEGLEQGFNSLDAQREACEAFILSQRAQGWKSIGCYDDGGFSGGNVERPGLQRLLADIALRRIKVVVAKLVELFDAHAVSFVSVTQQFNTTSSMGRLTLNVLLSFAQFEREVTGERIRDKIAASKRKGMWMGGFAPLGYVPHERTLVIDEPRAQRVREIYELYLRLGCVRRLKLELDARGWKTPERHGKRPGGGRPFTRGHLYRLLSNPVYVGGISHKGVVHPGQHPPIVAQDIWQAAQARLAENAQGHHDRIDAAEPSLLAGLLRDAEGRALKPTHARKGSKRYRYYHGQAADDEPEGPLRIPAPELETAVLDELRQFLRDERRLLATLSPMSASEATALFATGAKCADLLQRGRSADRLRIVNQLVADVVVTPTSLEIRVREAVLHRVGNTEEKRVHSISVPVQFKRGNHAMRLVVRDQAIGAKVPDAGLVALLARANRWFAALRSGEHSIASLAEAQRQAGRDVTRTIYLAFLAPDIVEHIAHGKQPIGLGVRRLMALSPLPMDWAEQRKVFSLG
jgi:DNA invertase Pin-like site-specific DNA recombinase